MAPARQVSQRIGSDELKRLNISPNVHYAIEKMMAKERDMRYQHPQEIVDELEAFLKTVNFEIIPIARPPDEPDGTGESKSGPIVTPRRGKKSSKKIELKSKRKRSGGDVKPTRPKSRRKRYR